MSGRRSHPRFAVAIPWNGAMRVLRDVVVDRTGRDELLAVSNVPAIAGEDMSLDLISAGRNLALKVKVLESRPVMVEGAVRHRIRLAVTDLRALMGVVERAPVEAADPDAPAVAGGNVAAEAI
jgi:hypothetical protein